jgi:ferritin-like metal-binding protein YciE
MGLVARKTQTLEDLFHNQLNILYELEIESRKTLRQMAESASDTAVREELSAAVKETELHAARLDELFASIDTKPDALSCGCVGGCSAIAANLRTATRRTVFSTLRLSPWRR